MALDEIRQHKIETIKKLRKGGVEPYPADSLRSLSIADALKSFEQITTLGEQLTLAGRIMAIREHGSAAFYDIDDGSARIQAHISEDKAKSFFTFFTDNISIGDIVEVSGGLFVTKRGERSIETLAIKILTKALLPLPEKWHGLQDIEERLRHRYVDLIMNSEERELFLKKSRFWQSARSYLLSQGGLEVETPVLERIPGGADAEPFATHHNALNIDLYLRISLELNLKRLIVSGYEKVFEIGRIFRNEGIDREHLQDYTQLELYWAYFDYEKLMVLIRDMYIHMIKETLGRLKHVYQDQEIDWSGDWPRIDYYQVFQKYTGLDLSNSSEKDLTQYAHQEGIDTTAHFGRGRLIDIIFKKKVRPHFIQPSFLILPPVDIEPLAKRWPADPNRVERFQIMAGGTELGKGFSELNDPLDQRQRFEEQTRLREEGDKEAQRLDEDFIEALEYGMPPTAGFGMSERVFAFIINRPIRETVFFPLMRPKESDK